MLAVAVLASLWAQAEPAPPEAPPAPPAVAPSPTPTPPAAAVARDSALAVYASFAHRLASEGQRLGPANGFSIGGGYERRYLTTPAGFELGAGLDFFYDRFATDVTGSSMVAPGQEQEFPAERVISQTGFALVQTAAWRAGRVRPFAKVGFGMTVAYFSSPEIALRPGSFDAVQPLARGALGLSVVVAHDVAICAQGGYTLLFTRPGYTTSDAVTYSFLGDLLDLGLGVVMQF
jgi:hypothetical protein